MAMTKKHTIPFRFSEKHKDYIKACTNNTYNIAEGAVRAGKTVDNVFAFAHELRTTRDRIHLASGSTVANAKLNIGDANGFGLEFIFRGQSHWGKYKDNDCLFIKGPSTGNRQRIVIFAGAGKADSFKKIRGNSYGMWIATEINLHHASFIKEAFNRTAAAETRKFFWDLNPDNPNADIYRDHIDRYREKAEKGELLGGCNYMHCTIDDNINISQRRREEIKSQYDPGSIWYMRDILGKRCVAEGLIYRKFAEGNYLVPKEMYAEDGKLAGLRRIIIGVDFGGTKSGHAFVATGIIGNYREVVVLMSERHFGDIAADDLGNLLTEFVINVTNRYGAPYVCYADSAESVLIRSMRKALMATEINLMVKEARKDLIINRIRLEDRLINQGRLFHTKNAETFRTAMSTAVWDPSKPTKNERLDDGSSDIDTLDAFEYTIERDAKRYIMAQ